MPAEPLSFRPKCGCFVAVFVAFMLRRAKNKVKIRTLKLLTLQAGVTVGLLLAQIFFCNLLQRCGDVESNPGPPKADPKLRQTRLSAKDLGATGSKDSERDSEPTLGDVMALLYTLNSKFDDMKTDFRALSEGLSILREEVSDLKENCTLLRQDNDVLKSKNECLEKKMQELERKTDDLEGRSKRNNLIIHGLLRLENETGEDCEGALKDLITDKLELVDDVQFDRVHRLNARPNSPVVARCTYFKDKVKILKAKRKLQGSDVFIGEDFSVRVRDIRRQLVPHLKKARSESKKATMVYDHLIIEGKRLTVDDRGDLCAVK